MDMTVLIGALVEAFLKAGVAQELAELLAQLCASLTARLRAEMAEPEILKNIQSIVDGINVSYPEWEDTKKFQWAVDAILQYLATLGVDFRRSTTNTLIELSVVNLEPVGEG